MSTVLANTITAVGGGGSTVKVNNDSTFISDSGAVTDSNLVQGLAKQWCHYDGEGSPTIADSFNVSSLNDLGTATFQQVCTNNFANANYSVTAMPREENGYHFINEFDTTAERTTALIFTATGNQSGSTAEVDGRSVTVHGDLA